MTVDLIIGVALYILSVVVFVAGWNNLRKMDIYGDID